MTLDEFLYDTGITLHEFARRIDYHPNYLSDIKNGKKKPSKRMIYVVDKMTQGRVKL